MSLQLYFALSLVASAPAPEITSARFVWKFEQGRPFFQKLTTETNQTMRVQNNDIQQKQKQTFVFRWLPVKQQADRSWLVKQTVEVVQMEIEIGGNKISYDSLAPAPGGPLADFFNALVGAEMTLTVSPDMKVTKVEGREAVVKKLAAANPQMEGLVRRMLSDEGLAQMSGPAFAPLPGKAVKKGETWVRDSKVEMGPLGTYSTRYTCTYNGPVGRSRIEKVSVKAAMTYKAPPEGAGGLPFKIKKADLKTSEASGTLEFHSDRRRVEKVEMKMALEGTLSIEVGGMTTDVELKQAQTTTLSTSDENPLTGKK